VKGGIDLTQENQSYLRFSLEESVWFRKGQEVEELYSISLDPNVTITEDAHYVYIRGTLDLSGEYKNDAEDEEIEDYTSVFLPKSVQTVERYPNGMNEFVHRFPVDITIPSSRIASIEDIDVSIQTFDYDIPERNCLKLQADLFISGIYGEAYAEPENEEEQDWDEESTVIADERVEEVEDAELEDEAVEIEITDVLYHLDELVEKDTDLADKRVEATDATNHLEEEKEAAEKTYSSEDSDETTAKYPAGVPPIPDFQPIFRKEKENEGELFEPFTVESKRTPEIEEREEAEPLYLSKKQDLPLFDIPVPKYQEQNQEPSIQREAEAVVAKEVEQEREVKPVATKEVKQERKIEPVVAKEVEQEREVKPVATKEVKQERKIEPVIAKEVEQEREVKPVATKEVKQERKIEPVIAKEVEQERKAEPVIAKEIEKEQEEVSLRHLVKNSERPSAPIAKIQAEREHQQESKKVEQPEPKASESLSIMDFFGRKQEEEHVRVKVCIVQQGETLDDLAERYSISVHTILQSNELQPNQDIYEGQVLYIPKSTAAYKN
jgi:stage VI sporulation protein D